MGRERRPCIPLPGEVVGETVVPESWLRFVAAMESIAVDVKRYVDHITVVHRPTEIPIERPTRPGDLFDLD